MRYTFRTHTAADCPDELYAFRYKIYVEEMNRPQSDACHETKTIKDFLDDTAHHTIVYCADEIVACVRNNLPREGALGYYEDFYGINRLTDQDRAMTSICTRYMVAKEHRRTSLSLDILRFNFIFGLTLEVDSCYMDCNSHLVRYFSRFGYVPQAEKHHPEYGDVTILRLNINDTAYLKSVGSPFLDNPFLGGATAEARLPSGHAVAAE